MITLLQEVHFEGPLGIIVAAAVLIGIIVVALKGIQWMWRAFVVPARAKFWRVRVAEYERELLEFLSDWFDRQRDIAIFIVDPDIRVLYANQKALRMFDVELEDIQGKRWQRLANSSDDLAKVIAKWNEAQKNQVPYINTGTFMVNGVEQRYITRAEPFVFRGNVRYFLARLQPIEETNIRQLPSAREQQ